MELNVDNIREQIKTQEAEVIAFSKSAQEEINKRQQNVQTAQMELQNLVKQYQKEIDRKEGAIEGLKVLIGEQTPVEDKPKARKPKKA